MNRRPVPLPSLLLPVALLSGGCTMAPKYERPALPVTDAFHPPPGAPAPAVAPSVAPVAPVASEVRWQDFFTDPRLVRVVEEALANNRDLRVATLGIEKARALYRIQRSELNPTIGVQATGQRYRIPEKMGENGEARTVGEWSVGLGLASWELDFFGRLRSLKDRSLEQYLATEQAQRATRVSVVAAVAATWLQLAADGESLRLSRETLEAQRASYDMIEASRDAGVASDLDLRQAESQVETARASVAAYTGAVAVSRNALDLLVGAPVGDELLPRELGAVADAKAVSAGLPSEVLLNRPDILAAEHQLRAANANIGAARAAFFPRISLTAGIGTMSPDLGSLFAAGTRTWTFAPQVLAPLFASGSLLAQLKVSKVDREIAVAQYEKAIQAAFAEVNDALALRATLVEQREAQDALVESLRETLRLSDARYRAGIDGYLGVLVAQRALFNAQRVQVGVHLLEQVNLVTLYKVLGGGA
ncbi:MAG: efflux transporter outer membrane subunit [Acidobacteria bacterium]|nr:MAG: efflux transporter outer membrane subunit [Acidobacteriota bacterium]MCE7957421.1 efflux transporter outer membrane subunit [Acidobacteria bacterium ACB2]